MPKQPGKTETVKARITNREKLQIEFRANLAGLKVSDYLRKTALQREIPRPIPQVNKETYSELTRIGININQLTRAVNTALKLGHSPTIDPAELENLQQTLKKLQLELLGVEGAVEAEEAEEAGGVIEGGQR
jgi:hypothetical protein